MHTAGHLLEKDYIWLLPTLYKFLCVKESEVKALNLCMWLYFMYYKNMKYDPYLLYVAFHISYRYELRPLHDVYNFSHTTRM